MVKKLTIEDVKDAIDDLAVMVNKGFTETDKYIDKRMDSVDKRMDLMDKRMDKVESLQRDMLEELQATHEDVRHIHTTVTMLVHSEAAYEAALTGLKDRVYRLEQKAGFAKAR